MYVAHLVMSILGRRLLFEYYLSGRKFRGEVAKLTERYVYDLKEQRRSHENQQKKQYKKMNKKHKILKKIKNCSS